MLKTVGEGAENALFETFAPRVSMDYGFTRRGSERVVVDAQHIHLIPRRHQRHIRAQVLRDPRRGVQRDG